MMSTFSYPVFSRKDIIEILSQFFISTSEEGDHVNPMSEFFASLREKDLMNPTPDLVSYIYTSLLNYLDLRQEEDHGQADFIALEQLENPDFHVDSVRIMNLCQKIKEVVALVSCPTDFTLRDLVRPDTHRTGVFLSAILNFCLHMENKFAFVQPFCNEVNSHEELHSKCKTEISKLKLELSNLKDASDREQPFIQELDSQVKELRQTIHGLNNRQMSLQVFSQTQKEKSTEISERILSAELALVQSAQENVKLRSKIVQSPDKLQGALEEKKSIRAKLKNSERSAMQSCQENTAIFEVHSKALKKMTKHFAQMQAIQEQGNSAKTIDKDVKVIKAKLSAEGDLGMSLEAKLVECQGKVQQLEELRMTLEKEKALKHEEDNKELDHVKMEFESRKCDLVAKEKKVEAMVSEVDSIYQKINSVKESGAITQQQLRQKSEEIVNEFHRYSQSIETSMQRVETDLVGSCNNFCSGSAN